MRIYLHLFFICTVFGSFGQNEHAKWYFGRFTGLDFMVSPPAVINHNTLNTFEGSASMADAAGNLLFYTDGVTVWNQQQLIMANGTGLLGNSSTVQSALIVKQPGSQNLYYLFTLAAQGASNGLRYSIIDMSLAAGMGSVTVKNVPVSSPCTEQLNGTRHCNGVDVWIVTHDYTSNNFQSFLLTSSGLNFTPVISSVGPIPPTFLQNNTVYGQGTIKLSPSGKKLGLTFINGSTSCEVAMFDFNKSTGVVSNYLSLLTGTNNSYGCEFSQDGTKFYTTLNGNPTAVLQWDLCAGTNAQILASMTNVGTPPFGLGQLQLAPNGKIYIVCGNSQTLSAINSPNQAGLASNYTANALSVANGTNGAGLPNFIGGAFRVLPVMGYSVNPQASCSTDLIMAINSSTSSAGCAAANESVMGVNWNFGHPASGALNTSTLTTPSHNFGAPGTYTVKAVVYYQCGADTVSQVVSVSGPSIGITSNSCTGVASAILSAGSGPFTYTWLPGAQNTASANVVSGIYTVSIAGSNGACAQTTTVSFSHPPLVTVAVQSSTNQLCAGSSVTLQASAGGPPGNFAYAWTGGPATASYVPASTSGGVTVYTVTATNQNGCSKTATYQVLYLSNPALGLPSFTICRNTTAVLTATGAVSYTWMPGNSTGSNYTTTPATTQVYTVAGTYTNGCSSQASATLTVVGCTGLAEQGRGDALLHYYPNPFNEVIYFEARQRLNLVIYDGLGREVKQVPLSAGLNPVSTEGLGKGIYFFTCQSGAQSVVGRILKVE